MPKGEHLKGKKSMNPAARSVLHEGVHDGRFIKDRRHTKRYDHDTSNTVHIEKFPTKHVVLDGNVPVGSFEDWLIGNLDKNEELSKTLRALEADRPRKNALAKLFWQYLDEQGVTTNAGS